ncbi:helix-hairpin-helix domain-containing protein [Halioxenophilus aromaticivorans]|uniref:Helix-hairpin-helix domain-containing protein n=1 Tax=Halioxenophilus aromaticivorans TaxID=1306992 RepID=A0AAV3U1I8_9ALTE
MAFSPEEKQALLAVKGVGPTVVQRFEEVGVDSFAKLSKFEAKALAQLVADMLGSTCWALSY